MADERRNTQLQYQLVKNTLSQTGHGIAFGDQVGKVVPNLIAEIAEENFINTEILSYALSNEPDESDSVISDWTCEWKVNWNEFKPNKWTLLYFNGYYKKNDKWLSYTITPANSQNVGVYMIELKPRTSYVLQVHNDITGVDGNYSIAWLYGQGAPLFTPAKVVLCKKPTTTDETTEETESVTTLDSASAFDIKNNYLYFNSGGYDYAFLILPGMIGRISARDSDHYEYRSWTSYKTPRAYLFESEIAYEVDQNGCITNVNAAFAELNKEIKKLHYQTIFTPEEIEALLNYPPIVTPLTNGMTVSMPNDWSDEKIQNLTQFLAQKRYQLALVPCRVHEVGSYRSYRRYSARFDANKYITTLRTINVNNSSVYDPYRIFYTIKDGKKEYKLHGQITKPLRLPWITVDNVITSESKSLTINWTTYDMPDDEKSIYIPYKNYWQALSLCGPNSVEDPHFTSVGFRWAIVAKLPEEGSELVYNYDAIKYIGLKSCEAILIDRRLSCIEGDAIHYNTIDSVSDRKILLTTDQVNNTNMSLTGWNRELIFLTTIPDNLTIVNVDVPLYRRRYQYACKFQKGNDYFIQTYRQEPYISNETTTTSEEN